MFWKFSSIHMSRCMAMLHSRSSSYQWQGLSCLALFICVIFDKHTYIKIFTLPSNLFNTFWLICALYFYILYNKKFVYSIVWTLFSYHISVVPGAFWAYWSMYLLCTWLELKGLHHGLKSYHRKLEFKKF